MKSIVLGAVLLIAASQSAAAASQTVNGNSALALAGLVAQQSPTLSFAHKTLLAKYLNGWAAQAPGLVVRFTASSVKCRASNVDLTTHSCELVFGPVTKTLTNRSAHELYATLIENGVASDGAAGSIYETIVNLACTIKADDIADRAGGGAQCSFEVP